MAITDMASATGPASPNRLASPGRPVPRSFWRRISWMIVLWSAGVALLGAASLILRLWLKS
jgi:hypothetical protein